MPVFVSFARFINRTYSAVIPCIRSHLPHHRIESRFDTISDKAQDCKLFFHFCAIFCAPLHICPKCTNNTGYRPFFQAGGCFLPAEKRDDRRGRPAGGAERPAVSPAGRTKCGRAYSAGFFRAGAVRPQPDISPPGGPGLFGCSRPPRFAARTPRRTPRPFAASRHPGPRAGRKRYLYMYIPPESARCGDILAKRGAKTGLLGREFLKTPPDCAMMENNTNS